MAEIVPVVSEALEAQVRNLLPSQRGFGEDLQASNVIMPIIDLTAAAQGSQIPTILQTALAFGSQTAFTAQNSTVVLANTPGFYRVIGGITVTPQSGLQGEASLVSSDGLSTKSVYKLITVGYASTSLTSQSVDFVVFLKQGETVSANTNTNNVIFAGSSRQIADVNGNLVYPNGFTPQ